MTKMVQFISINLIYNANKCIIHDIVILVHIYQIKYLNTLYFLHIQACYVSRISLASHVGIKQTVKTLNNIKVCGVSHQNWNLRTGPV